MILSDNNQESDSKSATRTGFARQSHAHGPCFTGVKSVHYSENDPGLVWTKDSRISIDLDTSLDSDKILTPNVIRLPDGGFRMYYNGAGPNRPVKESQGYILSASSTDGVSWHKEPGIRIDVHQPDATLRVLCPDVIPLPDGRWRIYFQAAATDRPDIIASAVSEDGLTWQREPGTRVAAPHCSYGSPRCLYIESPDDPNQLAYRLYFHQFSFPFRSGLNEQNHIISAISDDGLEFQEEPGVRITQQDPQRESYCVYGPEVIRLSNGTYRMYYSGWSEEIHGGIFAATSLDGLNWTKDPGPLLDLDRPLDCRMVSEPCVIELGSAAGSYRLYYEAKDKNGRCRILSATSS